MKQEIAETAVRALVNALRLRTLESCILTSEKYDVIERNSMRDEAANIEAMIREALKSIDPSGGMTERFEKEWRESQT